MVTVDVDKDEEEVVLNKNDFEVRFGNKSIKMKPKNKIVGKINGVTPLICVVAFLLLGFLKGAWHPGWMVFFAIPLVATICDVFTKKRIGTGIVTIIVIITYIGLGVFLNAWHPAWIIFFAIPISGIILEK